jgi:hypothetical protein
MNDTLSRVKAIQAERGWNFDRSFQYVMSEDNHTGSFGRDPVDKGAKVIAVATDASLTHKPPNKKDGRHPAIIEELSKHWQLEQQRKKWGEVDHANRLAKIRQLMEADPALSFDGAFTQIIQQESVVAPAKAAQTAAHGNGKLMLIQGSHAGFAFNIHTGKRAGVNGQSE